MALPERRVEPPWIPIALGKKAYAGRWTLIISAVLLLATIPPMLVAALRTPSGSIFSGYVVIARDAYVYQALWKQGWAGGWLFHSPYTSEPLAGIFLYPWYLWSGHLLGWAAGPWLYHLVRLLGAAALLGSLWLFLSELFRSALLRRWAFVLCTLGGGVGIFLPNAIQVGPLVTKITEMQSPGSSVADLIAMAPHLAWAMALMCWIMVVALRQGRRSNRREVISGVAAIVALQLIYPQLSILAVVVVGSWAAIQRLRRPLRLALMGAAVQLPYLAYLAWVWKTDPAALAVVRASLEVGDPFGFLVLSHLVASALIIVAVWRRRLRGDLWLPGLWIGGMTLFMFFPGISGVLGRSFMASSVPFGACATAGLLSLLRSVRVRPWRQRLLTLTLAASSLYGLFSLAQPYWIAALRLDARAEYESSDEAALLQRLAPHVSARDVVLTTYLDGVFVPAQTDARAFVGHPDMTIDAARKSAQANAYFDTWSSRQRSQFALENGIDYVLVTDPAIIARLDTDSGLRLVDREADAALFSVVR